MDELNDKALEQIPIPEGLEERLSAKIDEWEQEERNQRPSAVACYPASCAIRLCRQRRPRLWCGVSLPTTGRTYKSC